MKTKLILILIVAILFSSCADVQPHIKECLEGHEYGFWGGMWHGMIAPIAFIGQLFDDDISVYAINNNGGWYLFGFMWGIGALFSGYKSTKK